MPDETFEPTEQDIKNYLDAIIKMEYISDPRLLSFLYQAFGAFDDQEYIYESGKGEHGESGADYDSILELEQSRAFFKNDSGEDVVIKYAGKNYRFEDGVTYCSDPQEKSFFMSKAKEMDLDFVDSTYEEWIADGDPQSYFW